MLIFLISYCHNEHIYLFCNEFEALQWLMSLNGEDNNLVMGGGCVRMHVHKMVVNFNTFFSKDVHGVCYWGSLNKVVCFTSNY